jgi:hypothetical protein
MAIPMTETVLRERLKAKPDSLAFARLADLYRKSGNIAQAIDLCMRGVEAHPDYCTGRIILGRCYLEQEHLDKAVDAFMDVCRIDRRNIVALKMLADIFMRQGFREKAGDLFSLLARIDPYNDVLTRSAAQTRGSGKRDLYEILGITVEPRAAAAPALKPPKAPSVFLEPTMTQIVTPQELGISPPPPSAGSIDGTTATELATEVDVDQVLAEATTQSGSDITERMTDMFVESEKTAAEPPAEERQPSILDTIPVPESAAETPVEETIEVEPLTEVPDGNTITARIDTLFGKDTLKMPAIKEVPGTTPAADASIVEELLPSSDAALEETMIVDADTMKLKEDSGIFIKEAQEQQKDEPTGIIGEDDRTEELVTDETPETIDHAAESSAAPAAGGVEDLFKGFEDITATPPSASTKETPEPAVDDLIVSPDRLFQDAAEDTFSGDDVTKRIDQMFEKNKAEPAPTEQEVSDLFAIDKAAESKEEEALDKTDAFENLVVNADVPAFPDEDITAVAPSPEDTISGDDVAERIEDVFKKPIENKEQSVAAAKDANVTDETSLASERAGAEDTISGDDVVERIEDIFKKKVEKEERLFAAEEGTKVTDETSLASEQAGAEDTISGDDVVERIEDIFKKKIEKEERALAAEEGTKVTDETSAATEPPGVEDTISGDDVVERITGIFEKKPGKTEVSLGHPGGTGMDSEAEATVVFERDEKDQGKGIPVREESSSAQETLDEVVFEIKEPPSDIDTLFKIPDAESVKPIQRDSPIERTEAVLEQKAESPWPAESTGTGTESIDDTELSGDSVIETVGIMTGNDVEERLNDFFKEAKPPAQETEELLPFGQELPETVDEEASFKPANDRNEDYEETLIAGDLDELLNNTSAKKAAPPAFFEKQEATIEAPDFEEEPGENAGSEPLKHAPAETAGELTTMFEDFTPGSVPEAPPPAPEVPLFLTDKEKGVDSNAVLAEVDSNDSPYDIPDHVLTPTLADLYFQQGQPLLALSIYRRLLEKCEGGNEKFQKRIVQIEQSIANPVAPPAPSGQAAAAPAIEPEKSVSTATPPASRRKTKPKEASDKIRPLAGIRLKKRPKIQWRKKAGEK